MPVRLPTRLLAAAFAVVLVAAIAEATVASHAGAASSTGSYVVQPGDSLWRIANADGITVDALASANGLSPNGVLPIGITLTLPASAATPSATGAATPASSSPSAPGGSFCQTFTAEGGPQGVLPSLLAQSPDLLGVRPLFVEWAEHYGIAPALVEAVAWQESGWQQGVVSSAGAVGVGQLLPSTAVFVQDDLVGEPLDIASVNDNIRMSAALLAYLSQREDGNLCATIAAYYEGPTNLATYGVFTMTEPYVEDVEALLPQFE